MVRASINAPVKGRPGMILASTPLMCFNPRPREGATPVNIDLHDAHIVSIHAPVKGRRAKVMAIADVFQFQSTPP